MVTGVKGRADETSLDGRKRAMPATIIGSLLRRIERIKMDFSVTNSKGK
jgi:hypothetical protein